MSSFEMSVSQNVMLQNTGTQHNGQDGSNQSPKNLQNVEADKNSSENVGPVSTGLLKVYICGINSLHDKRHTFS